ncbi:MAG: hypothetical protein NC209_04000 [Alistipes sp.]|nr:hypothetical protein [Lachnospiraceae bacterium]MCM1250294.1 hypothetical protein [Alistipes sp.]MCM1301944.1 hypothetical protein [Bacteroides cellulosilyticus]
MELLRIFVGFLEGSDNSLRIDVVKERMRNDELRYKTMADSKREMRGDMQRLLTDLKTAIEKTSQNGKESRTKQDQ